MNVELFGIARALAGVPAIEVGGDRMTSGELGRALILLVPSFSGNVVDPETHAFIEPNLLLLDGRRAVGDSAFTADDRPCVLFLPSGG